MRFHGTLTRREEKALAVLEETVRAAWGYSNLIPDDDLDRLLTTGRARLIYAMRRPKPKKP